MIEKDRTGELELRTLREEDEAMFRRAVERFNAEESSFVFAFDFNDDTDFKQYVHVLEEWSRGDNLPGEFVPCSYFAGVVDGEIIGRVSVRHRLNEFLERIGGHVGYCVVPGFRRKGYATEMLKRTLPICASLGISKVLVTCDVDNHGSIKVIEKCGGDYEGTTDCPELKVQKRRYWIEIKKYS